MATAIILDKHYYGSIGVSGVWHFPVRGKLSLLVPMPNILVYRGIWRILN